MSNHTPSPVAPARCNAALADRGNSRPSLTPADLQRLTGDRFAGVAHAEAFDTEERAPHGTGFAIAILSGALFWATIAVCFWLLASGAL